MKSIGIMALCVMVVAGAAHATAVMSVTGGTATGSAYENIPPYFDATPATIPVAGTTTDSFGSAGGFYAAAGRAAYFDFGDDWADMTIDGVWFGLKQWGTNPNGVAPQTFWSADTGKAFDGGDTAAPDFGMWSWTAATSDKSWQRVFSGSVTPQARYYILAFDGTQNMGNRLQEIVFTGEIAAAPVVPEPMTMAGLLVSLGGVGGYLRRRRA